MEKSVMELKKDWCVPYGLEYKQNAIEIGGKKISTWKCEFISCPVFGVEAGTNGYMGGDAGHGSRTYVRLSGDGEVSVRLVNERDGAGSGFELIASGDMELGTIIKAMEFIVEALKEEAENPSLQI